MDWFPPNPLGDMDDGGCGDFVAMAIDCSVLTSFSPRPLECSNSKECSPAKHHYDECVERVTGQIENDGKASEDCVEECKFSLLPFRPLHVPLDRKSVV